MLETIEWQEETIARQNKLIAKLLNENAEKENMIEVLFRELKLSDN